MFDTYQKNALKTALLPNDLTYNLEGLADEIKEILQKLWFTRTSIHDLEKEIGDAFWFCAVSAYILKDPDEEYNFAKICRSASGSIFSWEDITKMLSIAGLAQVGRHSKIIRDGDLTGDKKADILDIIGDITYYLRYLINYYKLETKDVLDKNIYKLQNRKLKNTLHGDGDNR